MVEIGTISNIDKKGYATIKFSRKMACEHCKMCFKPKDENFVQIRVKNTLDAKTGEKVSVSMGTQVVLLSSFLVYIIPVVAVALTLILTQKLDEIISFLLAVVSLIISFAIISVIDKQIKTKKDYLPKMVAIIEEKES